MPPKHESEHDVWSLTGQFRHWIYGPKGEAQGLMLDVSGIPVQFVIPPHEAHAVQTLKVGRNLTLEGTLEVDGTASADGPGHDVYRLVHVVMAGAGETSKPATRKSYSGKVVRFNHAKHGQANGVILDSGDFIHTKPHGLTNLGLNIGDPVVAEGECRPLFTGKGVVVEATRVNGQPLA